MKPIVHYTELLSFHGVGSSAVLMPVDHYATDRVSNTKPCMTSQVVGFDKETGEIETLNTLYRKFNENE